MGENHDRKSNHSQTTQMDEEDVLDNFETLCQTTLINPRLSTAIQRVPSVMRRESHHNFDIRSKSGSAKTIGSVGSHHLPRNSHKNEQMEEEDVLDGLGNYTSNTSFFAYPNLIPREKVSTRKSRFSTSISRESAAALFMEEETGFGTKKTIKVNNRRQSILPQATKAKRVSKQVAKQSEKNENTNSHFSHRKKSSTVLTDFIIQNPQGRRGGMFPKNQTAESMGVKPVSLQVKQWETIHEFESEEQQKYLCFASLKYRSIRIFYLMLLSLVLMAIDLALTSQASTNSKTNIQRFVLPSCWNTLSEPVDTDNTIDRQDIIEFTYDLLRDPLGVDHFGTNKYFGELNYLNATTDKSYHKPYEDFIEREMLFGNLGNFGKNGQRSSLINLIQNIWSKKRVSGEFRFHPLSSEQNGTSSPSTVRSLQKLRKEEFTDSTLYVSILFTRTLSSVVTLLMIIYIILYYQDILRLNFIKHIVIENTPVFKHPGFVRKLVWSLLITIIHVPPGDYFMELSGKYPVQLFTLFRLLHTFKWLRETNPMRYNRLTEILCIISSVKVRDKFLMKIPFMRNPLTSIIYTYLIIVTVSTFTIYSLESKLMSGYCLTFQKSVWVVMVTSTNVGYDDVIVGTVLSKTMLAFTSISGIAIMALLVNRLMNGGETPSEANRIFDQSDIG